MTPEQALELDARLRASKNQRTAAKKRGLGFWLFVFMLVITAAAIVIAIRDIPSGGGDAWGDVCAAARQNARWKTYAELTPSERERLYSDCAGR
jgi:hypothetical protein